MGCLLLAAALCCSGILAVARARSCPEAADFLPCTCDIQGISCGKANSTAELTKAFQTDGPKEHKELWIQRSTVESFPPGVLGDFVFRNVYIEMNTNLTSFNLQSINKSRTFIMKLSLFGNALTTFAYSGIRDFPKLTMLNLGKNRLERIPDHAFQHPKLKKLVLSDNPIQAVGAYAFSALPKPGNAAPDRNKNYQTRKLRSNPWTRASRSSRFVPFPESPFTISADARCQRFFAVLMKPTYSL
uniref:Putative membrane glycoprotein lig-1 n=1 Tax=Ixodes ricinus TaxID=34613 RepID=A0A090X933_IXORI